MLFVFSPVFVADAKKKFGYYFGAPFDKGILLPTWFSDRIL